MKARNWLHQQAGPPFLLFCFLRGFSILLEAGSGTAAGFTDEEYTRHGGVQVAESSVEVLKQLGSC